MAADHAEHARIFKAFGDEKRLRILERLREDEKCAYVLTDMLHMPQSTLSYHMKILCESGVVVGREDGKWTYYSISETGAKAVITLFVHLMNTNR